MSETPSKRPEQETQPLEATQAQAKRAEIAGRILFMLAGGILLATLVSCACAPAR